MDKMELKKRTKLFALRVIKLVDALPNSAVGRVIGSQLLRSSTSVGANYRAACRGRSTAEFISKMGIVEEEVDESAWWLELIIDAELMPAHHVQALWKEADELTAIFTAAGRTAKQNASRRKSAIRNPKSEI